MNNVLSEYYVDAKMEVVVFVFYYFYQLLH